MISLTINGVTYQYPEPDDENWGTNATGWAEEVTTVLAGVYEPASTPLAASGQFRLPNTGKISWRDAANSADVELYVHSDNDLYLKIGANPPINLSTTAAGNVTGPLSATDNAIARFDGTSGQTIQNSVVTVTDSGNVNGVNVLTAVQADAADINATSSLTVTGTSALYGDTDVGNGTYTGTAPLLTVNAGTGDAGIRLQVNNTSANAWDIYNDNSDSDNLKFDYNGSTKLKYETANGDLVLADSQAGEVAFVINNTSTGDAVLTLRVNDSPSNQWAIYNDNSNSDQLKLNYGGTDMFKFVQGGSNAANFYNESISTATAPEANSLYPHSMVKAWGKIRLNSTSSPVLDDGFNVSSVSANSNSVTVTFRTNMANDDYAIAFGSQGYNVKGIQANYFCGVTGQTTSSFTFQILTVSTSGGANVALLDPDSATGPEFYFQVVGRQ